VISTPVEPVMSKQCVGQFWMYRFVILAFTTSSTTMKWSGLKNDY
jgi:hypothetical protein